MANYIQVNLRNKQIRALTINVIYDNYKSFYFNHKGDLGNDMKIQILIISVLNVNIYFVLNLVLTQNFINNIVMI